MSYIERELLHVPGSGGAALGAEATVQADVLILHHDAARLERVRDVEVLRQVDRRRAQPRAQLLLGPVHREGDAVRWADVDAGVAFDAEIAGEHGFDIAIEAALR